MKIVEFSIKDLKNEYEHSSLWSHSEIPISRHKVLSHLNNPRANPDDIVLIVVFNDSEEIIGYIGSLPDKINTSEKIESFAWITCWWVKPSPEYSRYSLILLFKMMKHYNDRIGISDFTERAKTIYDSSRKFYALKEKIEHKYFIRFCLRKYLPNKYEIMSKFTALLKIIDYIFNIPNDLRINFHINYNEKDSHLEFEYIKNIDIETEDFINSYRNVEFVSRSKDELNWILNYPWVITAPDEDKISKRYKFLSTAKSFYFLNVKIYEKQNLIGFIIFRIRDKELTIPYIYFKKERIELIADVIIKHILKLKADLFICRNEEINKVLLDRNFPRIHIRKNKRYVYLSRVLENITDINSFLQDGDGDNAFT